MAYTDLWRCKRCHTLPDITFLCGKRFLIACKQCGPKASIEGDSLDEVVKGWNHRHNPQRFHWKDAWQTLMGFLSYRREHREEQREITRRRKEDLASATRMAVRIRDSNASDAHAGARAHRT